MSATPGPPDPAAALPRELGLAGAVLLGLGSILGTGVFVSLGLAAGAAGPAVLAAVALAGALAAMNGLAAAQLAASHPVSGGTYEYGYRLLSPGLGFSAGWLFLAAKSASAATAALGCAGYLLRLAGREDARAGWQVPLALACLAAVVAVVLGGMRRSSRVNGAIVALTLLALGAVTAGGLWLVGTGRGAPSGGPWLAGGAAGLLEGAALVFVAFTGYGRVATLGEEVHDPARTIPRAVVATLVVSAALYLAVAAAAVGALGAPAYARAAREAAPLEALADAVAWPGLRWLVGVGAVTAMLGVLLNLVLGLSRVLLAMGRRGDAPAPFGRLDRAGRTPVAAVLAVGLAIGGLAAVGDVRATWTLSAFTVLVYYALTNAAALAQPPAERRFPRAVPAVGLLGCLGLAAFVDLRAWAVGLGLLAAGHLLRAIVRRAGTPGA